MTDRAMPEREEVERLMKDRRFRADAMNAVAGTEIEAMRGDNLAVLLCSEFEKHPDCPEDGEMDDHDCWPQWAVDRTNEVLEAVARRVLSLPAVAAALASPEEDRKDG